MDFVTELNEVLNKLHIAEEGILSPKDARYLAQQTLEEQQQHAKLDREELRCYSRTYISKKIEETATAGRLSFTIESTSDCSSYIIDSVDFSVIPVCWQNRLGRDLKQPQLQKDLEAWLVKKGYTVDFSDVSIVISWGEDYCV